LKAPEVVVLEVEVVVIVLIVLEVAVIVLVVLEVIALDVVVIVLVVLVVATKVVAVLDVVAVDVEVVDVVEVVELRPFGIVRIINPWDTTETLIEPENVPRTVLLQTSVIWNEEVGATLKRYLHLERQTIYIIPAFAPHIWSQVAVIVAVEVVGLYNAITVFAELHADQI
ncbi:hypothetical protein HK096_007271, partial [Nowakowskiella sp. JEL0078]